MNKQEAIEKIDRTLSLPRSIGSFPYDYEDGLRYAKHIINQIDEPEKPEIPWFVAEHIEYHKNMNSPMGDIFNRHFIDDTRVEIWLREALNAYDNLGKAWLFGYEVEKEKLYTARLKLVTQNEKGYLNKNCKDNDFFIEDLRVFSGEYQTRFTRSELEQLNVWDNPAFEIEEKEND